MSDENPPADHAFADDNSSGNPVEKNLKSRDTWTRFLFMVISSILLSLAGFVGSFVVILGFLWVLFTGEVNPELRRVGQSIAAYFYEVVRYLTFNTDDKPFPMGGAWPSGDSDSD